MYGISSENLKKKFKSIKNANLRNPWLFFSFILKNRSLDLYFEQEKLNNWFYGIKLILRRNLQEYKICSVSKFILTRIKLKLISSLQEFYLEKSLGNDMEIYKDLVNNICQGNLFFNCFRSKYSRFNIY